MSARNLLAMGVLKSGWGGKRPGSGRCVRNPWRSSAQFMHLRWCLWPISWGG